jgi:hypothetical protein
MRRASSAGLYACLVRDDSVSTSGPVHLQNVDTTHDRGLLTAKRRRDDQVELGCSARSRLSSSSVHLSLLCLAIGAHSPASLRPVLGRMGQRTLVIEHRAEIAHVEPTAAFDALEEMIRLIGNVFTD